jgi:integrase
MQKMKLLPVGTGLEVERAITTKERRRILDAADYLAVDGGKSKDRSRFKGKDRPQRKNYRGFRNRAIVYVLIETGMRRAAVTKINLEAVNFKRRVIAAEEKGGLFHAYQISREGIEAVQAYLEYEREGDNDKWNSPALFLSAAENPHGNGRLNTRMINTIWNQVCEAAGVEGRTPHSARHSMGWHIMEKTGNVAAIQRQLGHKNATYSLQYARITEKELDDALNDR